MVGGHYIMRNCSKESAAERLKTTALENETTKRTDMFSNERVSQICA